MSASVDDTARFEWSDTFQSKLLGALLTDKDIAPKALPLVDPRFFSAEVHVLVAGFVKDYWTKYKTLPEKFVVQETRRNGRRTGTRPSRFTTWGSLKPSTRSTFRVWKPGNMCWTV